MHANIPQKAYLFPDKTHCLWDCFCYYISFNKASKIIITIKIEWATHCDANEISQTCMQRNVGSCIGGNFHQRWGWEFLQKVKDFFVLQTFWWEKCPYCFLKQNRMIKECICLKLRWYLHSNEKRVSFFNYKISFVGFRSGICVFWRARSKALKFSRKLLGMQTKIRKFDWKDFLFEDFISCGTRCCDWLMPYSSEILSGISPQ